MHSPTIIFIFVAAVFVMLLIDKMHRNYTNAVRWERAEAAAEAERIRQVHEHAQAVAYYVGEEADRRRAASQGEMRRAMPADQRRTAGKRR